MTAEGIEALAESLEPTDRVVIKVSSSAREVARPLEGHCQRVVVSPDDRWIAPEHRQRGHLADHTVGKEPA